MSFQSAQLFSWGRFPRVESFHHPVFWKNQNLPDPEGMSFLPYGLGRSYGDSCLNPGNILIDTRYLRRFMEFDEEKGILRCEAGISLDEILQVIVPRGWFLKVTPGTKFVTLGGAIANDVHGKNHHREGTFGCHVKCFELLRSDNTRLICSPDENTDLYKATIGGLGLTGLITWAEIELRAIETAYISVEAVKFENYNEFFKLTESTDKTHEFTVAWFDCLGQGKYLGRGIFYCGNLLTKMKATRKKYEGLIVHGKKRLSVPFNFPGFCLNKWSLRAFNELYYRKQTKPSVSSISHYDSFFYPLDAINNWNRIYGKAGFFQYQAVFPTAVSRNGARDTLEKIAESGLGSFLGVIKVFGENQSPGLLSFPKPGFTIALDFTNKAKRTQALFQELDSIVRAYDGILYPAKDARMKGRDFRRFYPQWESFSKFIDPAFSSGFWRRVMRPGAMEDAEKNVASDYDAEEALMGMATDDTEDDDEIDPIPV